LIADPRFLTRGDRKRYRPDLQAELEAVLAARSAAEWEELLSGVSVPAGRVLSVEDALSQPQIISRELLQEVDLSDSVGRPVSVVGSGVHVNGEALRPSAPPPRLGEQTNAILEELGYSPSEIEGLRTIHAI
jgi:crotonobetainyl-CoA:carnitine CoA-transferase CaiB-like acyl-CoA transferase